jgi:hypothetical protein
MTSFLGEIPLELGKGNTTICVCLECRAAANRIHMGEPGKSATNLRLDDCGNFTTVQRGNSADGNSIYGPPRLTNIEHVCEIGDVVT